MPAFLSVTLYKSTYIEKKHNGQIQVQLHGAVSASSLETTQVTWRFNCDVGLKRKPLFVDDYPAPARKWQAIRESSIEGKLLVRYWQGRIVQFLVHHVL
jgi:hypothetical protein